jgi:uncharacterized protein (DUF983 family)
VNEVSVNELNTKRDLALAIRRGLLGRCPNCGKGKLFRAFLKVADHCEVCGEPFHHQQADDAPAYFVILIVGHIVVPIVLAVEVEYTPPLWVHAAIFLPLTIGLSVLLLQPVKGAIIAWQWAQRMHGFNEADATDRASSQTHTRSPPK